MRRANGLWIAVGLAVGFLCTAASAENVSKRQVLADFEDGKLGVFAGPTDKVAATGHLTGKSVLVPKGKQVIIGKSDIGWLQYNFLRFDTYNPDTKPVQLILCWIDDSKPHGYYSWITRIVSVRPGKSVVEMNLSTLRRGEGSVKDSTDPRPFHWDAVSSFSISPQTGDLEMDNIRLEKVEFPKVEGVWAFDFGPVGSPVMLGTVGITPDSAYDDQVGYGWSKKGTLSANLRSRGPDTLTGDWINGINSTFTVKLPDGKYRVWMLWHDQGQWEFYQNFTHRSVKANGKTVVEEKMDGKEFLDRYFHFAQQEDLPGDDLYARYVNWYWQPKEFDVEAVGGKLDLTFDGSGPYAATVNGLIVYPVAKAAEAKAFIESINEWRKHEFDSVWSEQIPAKAALDPELAKSAGDRKFLVFRRVSGSDVGIFEAPPAAEVLDAKSASLDITCARDRYESTAFSLHALDNLQDVQIAVSDLKGEGGATLPKESVVVEQVRNKFKCIGFSGGGLYGSVPWLVVDGARSSIPKDANRTYLLTVHAPKDQAAGRYEGKLTIQAGGKDFTAGLAIRVLPLMLPDADVGTSMFSMGGTAPVLSYYPENEARLQADRERSMAFARQVGFNQIVVSGGVHFVSIQAGKAAFDVSGAKREVEAARKAGFPFVYLAAEGTVFNTALRDKGDAAKLAGFGSADDLAKAMFGGAIEACKSAGLPEPMWSFGDEPAETQAAAIVELHRRLREVAGARSYISWSAGGENQKRMLDVTSVCSLNVATAEDFKRCLAAGNQLWLNNQGTTRWAYGLYLWKAHQLGAQSTTQFTWSGPHADPYYPLDSIEDEWGVVFPDREGTLRPTTGLVHIRQGIDDYRYTLALRQAIEKAGADQKAPAAEAAKFLDDTFSKIKLENTGRDRNPQMTEEELNGYRRQVQEYLVKLVSPPR